VRILNIADGVLEVRTNPSVGAYQNLDILKRGQTVTSRLLSGTVFTVDELIDQEGRGISDSFSEYFRKSFLRVQ